MATEYTVTTQLLLDSAPFTTGFAKAEAASTQAFTAITAQAKLAEAALAQAATAVGALATAQGVGAIEAEAAAGKEVAAAESVARANVAAKESFDAMGIGGAMATLGVVIGLAGMAKSAIDTQAQITTLDNSLQNMGLGSSTTKMNDLTEANIRLGFTSVETAKSLQQFATITGSSADSIRLNALAMDIARAKHEDLATATMQVTMMTRGAQRGFQQFGVTLDTSKPKLQAVNDALNQVQQKVSGQMQKGLETTAVKLQVAKATFDDLASTIGKAVLPVINALLDGIQRFFPEIAIIVGMVAAWYTMTKVIKGVEAGINLAQRAMAAFAAEEAVADALNPFAVIAASVLALIAVVLILWNHFKAVRNIIVDILDVGLHIFGDFIKILGVVAKSILDFLLTPFKAVLKVLSFVHFPGAKEALQGIQNGIDDVGKAADTAGNTINSFQKTVDKLRDMKIPNPFQHTGANTNDKSKIDLTKIPAAQKNTAAAIAKKYASDLKTLNNEIDKGLADLKKTRQKGSDAIITAITSTFGNPSDIEKAFDGAKATAQTVLAEYDKLKTAIDDRMVGYAASDKARIMSTLQSETDAFTSLINIRDDLNKQITQAQKDLDNAVKQQTQEIDKIARSLTDYAVSAGILTNKTSQSIIRVVQTASGAVVTQGEASVSAIQDLTSGLQKNLTTMQDFEKNIIALQSRGLNADYIKQLVAAGVDKSANTVSALANASDQQIAVINDTYAKITDSAQNFASTTGATMYSAGVTSAQQYLTGLQAQQSDIQSQMTAITNQIESQLASIAPMSANVGQDTATSLLDNLAKYINDPKNQKAVLSNATALANQIKSIISSAMDTSVPSASGSAVADQSATANSVMSPTGVMYNMQPKVSLTFGQGAITVDPQGNATIDSSQVTQQITSGASRLANSRLAGL